MFREKILHVQCTEEPRTPGNTINEFLRWSTRLPTTVGSGILCYYLSTSSWSAIVKVRNCAFR